MSFSIVRLTDPTQPQIDAIMEPLLAFNAAHAPDVRYLPVALAVEDAASQITGGLWGKCYYDWLFVEYLVVPEPARGTGMGSELLRQAEAIAREHGCAGMWLDTFSFQALPFYEKLGFTRFGQIDGHPVGGTRYFLQKRFARADLSHALPPQSSDPA